MENIQVNGRPSEIPSIRAELKKLIGEKYGDITLLDADPNSNELAKSRLFLWVCEDIKDIFERDFSYGLQIIGVKRNV